MQMPNTKGKLMSMYQISVYYDGKLFSTHNYSNAIDAVHDFDLCHDSAMSKEYATYNLLEPSGKMHTKNFYANGKVTIK